MDDGGGGDESDLPDALRGTNALRCVACVDLGLRSPLHSSF
jgi:hypothetical protein